MAARRAGLTLLEVCVALVILAAALTALAQLVVASGRQRRSTDQRLAAMQELANQAERLAIVSWSELSPENLSSWEASDELTAALPAAQCSLRFSNETESPRARRITLSIAWMNSVGEQVAPVELSIWRHAPEAQP